MKHPVKLAALAALFTLAASESFACACGCGVFDVGTSAMLPTGTGGMAFIEYDFMNQNRNWSGTSRTSAADNTDKDIKTNFITVGGEYMFNRSWGVQVDVPYWARHFTTDTGGGNIQQFDHSAFGDVRLKGVYSGFSGDMSTGLTFGVKLPTGDYKYANFDRDTEIGAGSTDILLGAYHMGYLAGDFNWFANLQYDQPVLIQAGYRPGAEINTVAGIYYHGWSVGGVQIAPIAQIIDSERLQDRGTQANPEGSGYQRVLLSPGLEVDVSTIRIYADVAIPVYQNVRGNQLISGELFKINISRKF